MNKLNLSILIVSYNCSSFIKKMLYELLDSLSSYVDYEILLLDNNSTDNTQSNLLEFQDKISINLSDINNGFSKANNILIEKAKYDNILLLNPDVFGFTRNFWDKLLKEWDKTNPMFIKLVNEDGSFQDCVGEVVSFQRIFSRLNKKISYVQLDKITEVGMGIMAFMIATRRSYDEIGLISEDYYMYSEDMDWCYRAKLVGYKVLYNPNLQLTHLGGASASTVWKRNSTFLKKYVSERIFIKKYYSGAHRYSLLLINYLKILLCKIK